LFILSEVRGDAITNPNNSSIGEVGLHHLKMEGREVIDSFFGSGNIF